MSQNFIKELTQYIEDNSALVIGTNLFAVAIPQGKADDSTQIRSIGGMALTTTPNQFAAQVQVLTRAKNSMDSYDANHLVYDLLKIKGEITLPVVVSGRPFVILTATPWTMPQSTGTDEKGRYIHTSNWTLHMQGS